MIIGYIYDFNAFPPKAGNHRHAYELVQGMIRAGHSVRVLNDNTIPSTANYTVSELHDFLTDLDILYIRVDARPMKNSIYAKAIDQCQSAVVMEVNSPANESLAYSWLGGKTDLKKESLLKRFKRFLHATRKLPGIWLEESERKRLTKKTSAHICVTQSLANYCTQQLKARNVHVIPNGANILDCDIKNTYSKPNEKFTVLYSGSAIYPWQGLHYLNEVARLSLNENLPVEFVFCVSKVTEYIPVLPNTRILEGLEHKDILKEICKADVCMALYPDYPWSPWGLHNSPMKLFEYFSCGAATITSNIGQMKDLFTGKDVTLLSENDPRDILQQILNLKADPELKEKLGFNAYQLIKKEMNWTSVISKTIEVFNAVK